MGGKIRFTSHLAVPCTCWCPALYPSCSRLPFVLTSKGLGKSQSCLSQWLQLCNQSDCFQRAWPSKIAASKMKEGLQGLQPAASCSQLFLWPPPTLTSQRRKWAFSFKAKWSMPGQRVVELWGREGWAWGGIWKAVKSPPSALPPTSQCPV